MRKQLIPFTQGIKFCKISSSRGGGFNPKPLPCARHCLISTISARSWAIWGKYNLRYDTAVHNCKISGCALKQGSETHSSLRPSNLQLQNEAALMSYRIRTVEYRKCVAGPAGAHPGLQDRIFQTTLELRITMKYARKLSIFYYA